MNNQQPVVPTPMILQNTPQVMRPIQPGEIPPGRVQVALEYLAMLTFKTRKSAVVNDISIQVIDGANLTTAEANAQASACNALNDYFNGKLKPTYWERVPKEHHSECYSEGGYDERPEHPSMYIRCFACAPGPTAPDCRFCRGTGKLIVTPVSDGSQG